MSEPIPLRDGHSRHRPRRRGRGRRRGSARWEEKLRVEEEEEEVCGWCVPVHGEGSLAITRTLFSNTICCHLNEALVCSLRLLVFPRSCFLCTASNYHRVFIFSFAIHGPLSSLSIRCGYVSCARDNQLSHATPRLGPREFRGKEMNELASSLTRERGVDVFEERSDCELKEEEKRLVNY